MKTENIANIAAAIIISSSALFVTPTALAGDVVNASLACYVDTKAFDQLTADYCASGWKPGENNPTIAYFEVMGLPAGNYSYAWNSSCGTGGFCNKSIRKDTSGGVPINLSVTVRDNDSGAVKTVSATAEYIDVYN